MLYMLDNRDFHIASLLRLEWFIMKYPKSDLILQFQNKPSVYVTP